LNKKGNNPPNRYVRVYLIYANPAHVLTFRRYIYVMKRPVFSLAFCPLVYHVIFASQPDAVPCPC